MRLRVASFGKFSEGDGVVLQIVPSPQRVYDCRLRQNFKIHNLPLISELVLT